MGWLFADKKSKTISGMGEKMPTRRSETEELK